MEIEHSQELPAEPAGDAEQARAVETAEPARAVKTAPGEASETAPQPPIADGVLRALDPRAVRLDRLVGWIATAVIAGPALVALVIVLLVASLPGWLAAALALLWLALFALLAWSAQRWPAIAHRHAAYRVDELGIEIRRGVLWRAVINVPRSRVQHTDVSQGPLERGHGLGTLVIYTAGTDHARVDLHGLAHPTALAIRDHLLPRESGDAV